jgi:hypothetical protein
MSTTVSCSSNSGSYSAASPTTAPNRGPRQHPTSSTCPSRCTFPISKVIPFSKLRTDYRSYESRCRLAGHPSAAAAPPSPSLPVSSSSPPMSSFSSLRDTRLHENRLAWIRKEREYGPMRVARTSAMFTGANADIVGESTGATRRAFTVCGM